MWSDLYRCSVICACLSGCIVFADAGRGQELIPPPDAQFDPDASSPFLDEVPESMIVPDEGVLTPDAQLSPELPQSTLPQSIEPWQPRLRDDSAPLTVLGSGTLDRLHMPILRQDLKITGAQSCATSNCHAGPRPGVLEPTARRGMEYQIWVENDPHAQSWRTICSDESVDMMKRLGIMADGQIVLFGGWDGERLLDDTWVWDGEAWSRPAQETAGPSARAPFGIAYDEAREATILVGGQDQFVGILEQ